jgi:hypothetical protein
MVRRGRKAHVISSALALVSLVPTARAGGDSQDLSTRAVAPLEIPHTLDLQLAEKARKRNRKPDNVESSNLLVLNPGLHPVSWPKNSDIRARLLTPEVKSTPVVGWVAENLYRDKKDNGWSLEVDPGGGEYVVFYRYHPKR